jgi:hypothetical protein
MINYAITETVRVLIADVETISLYKSHKNICEQPLFEILKTDSLQLRQWVVDRVFLLLLEKQEQHEEGSEGGEPTSEAARERRIARDLCLGPNEYAPRAGMTLTSRVGLNRGIGSGE